MPAHPPGRFISTHSVFWDHPFTLICDITWENGENYIKSRFKFVFTGKRKLKEKLSLQKSRLSLQKSSRGSFLAGGIGPADLF